MSLSERAKNFLSFLNGFRKFTIMASLITVGIIFRLLGYITGAEFVSLLSDTAVAYMAFNGVEHLTNAVKVWVQGKLNNVEVDKK